MRIALATWSRRRAGGVETYVEAVLAALAAAGHEVTLWAESDLPESAAPIAVPPGAPVLALAADARDAFDWRPDAVIVNGLLNVALEARVLASAPALFVAHNFYGTCISGKKSWAFPVERPCQRRFGAGCLLHYFPHRCGGLNPGTMFTLYSRERRRLAHLADARRIVTLSAFMREEYLRHGFSDEQVVCVPYGPAQGERHMSGATRANAPDSLVFVGRLERLKGVHVLLEALPLAARLLNRSLSLTVVGDGPERASLHGQALEVSAAEPRVSIRFEGRLSPSGRDERLLAADVLVVPSLWPEPLGLVGFEAGQLGVPAVAFDVGGIRQWLEDGHNGVLAPGDPPTIDGLATAITAALRDRERLNSMRARARELARLAPTPARHADALVALLGSERRG